VIRKAASEDTKAIVAIWLDASRKAHDFIPYGYWLERSGDMERVYLPASETYVLEIEGSVVAFLSLVNDHVAALFVSPKFQGKGFGKELLALAKKKWNSLSLCVYKGNRHAVEFYKKSGFGVVAERLDEGTSMPELQMEWNKEKV
jgi:putative acetyltransferase